MLAVLSSSFLMENVLYATDLCAVLRIKQLSIAQVLSAQKVRYDHLNN